MRGPPATLTVGDPRGVLAVKAGRRHNLRLRQWQIGRALCVLRDKAEQAGIGVHLVDEPRVTDPAPPRLFLGCARYHGAIQLIIDPTGRKMAGKWVGFGKNLEVNSGPWDFAFRDPSTSKGTLEQYSVAPDPDSVV